MTTETAVRTPADAIETPLRRQWHRRWVVAVLVLMMLTQMAFAMTVAAAGQTATIDEPV